DLVVQQLWLLAESFQHPQTFSRQYHQNRRRVHLGYPAHPGKPGEPDPPDRPAARREQEHHRTLRRKRQHTYHPLASRSPLHPRPLPAGTHAEYELRLQYGDVIRGLGLSDYAALIRPTDRVESYGGARRSENHVGRIRGAAS